MFQDRNQEMGESLTLLRWSSANYNDIVQTVFISVTFFEDDHGVAYAKTITRVYICH